jgi:hypothetical protein
MGTVISSCPFWLGGRSSSIRSVNLLRQHRLFLFLFTVTDINLYPPIFILHELLLPTRWIEEASTQLLNGRNQKAHARFIQPTHALCFVLIACRRSASARTYNPLSRTYHPLFSRNVHGIINCRRRQVTVTCRCLTTCSCLRVVQHS